MKIAVGSDHEGYRYKEEIKRFLEKAGHGCRDFGTHSEMPVSYPFITRPVALAVQSGEFDRGIVLGISGNGEAMVANRLPGIRCALCWNRESAVLARRHCDANMLSLGAGMITLDEALGIAGAWLETPFEGGPYMAGIRQMDQKPATAGAAAARERDAVVPGDGDAKPAGKFDLLVSFRFVKYMEGDHSLEFQVDPGLKKPSIIHVPSSEHWNSEVPRWAWNRRDEILDRIREKTAHMRWEWEDY